MVLAPVAAATVLEGGGGGGYGSGGGGGYGSGGGSSYGSRVAAATALEAAAVGAGRRLWSGGGGSGQPSAPREGVGHPAPRPPVAVLQRGCFHQLFQRGPDKEVLSPPLAFSLHHYQICSECPSLTGGRKAMGYTGHPIP